MVPAKALISTKKRKRHVNRVQVKTISEILHDKKKLQEEKWVYLEGSSSPESSLRGLANAGAVEVGAQAGSQRVRMENLRGIHKQTAARLQAQAWGTKCDHTTNSNNETPKKKVFRINRNAINGTPDSSIQAITVKSFEEIMREKRLRRQQAMLDGQPEQPHNSKKATPTLWSQEKPTVIRPRITTPAAAPLPTESSHQAKPSVRQRLGLKPQTTFPVPGVGPQKRSSEMQANESSPSPHHRKLKLSLSGGTTVEVREVAASQDLHLQEPQTLKTGEAHITAPSKAVKLKVEPKLSANLPVLKPAAQKKRCLRRKALWSHCSVIGFEPPCKSIRLSAPVCSSEFGANTQQPSSLAEDVLSRSRNTATEQLTFSGQQSSVTEPPIEFWAHQSSVVSTLATAPAGTSSTVDDLDALLDEFIDNELEDETDPNKSVDDLLEELWKLINSSD